jgi:hypothetical protein
MAKVLFGTSTVDYTKDADVRVAYENLRAEARKQHALIEPIPVTPDLAKARENALKTLESYALSAEYHLQYLDEQAAHGRSKRATELWEKSNEYFQKGIEYDSMATIKSESGTNYQDTEFSDAVLEFIDSPVFAALTHYAQAKREDRDAHRAAAGSLPAGLQQVQTKLASMEVSPHMAVMQTAMGKALDSYRASAEHLLLSLKGQEKGNAEQADAFYDLSRKYLDIGREYETAAFSMWENK